MGRGLCENAAGRLALGMLNGVMCMQEGLMHVSTPEIFTGSLVHMYGTRKRNSLF